MTTNMGCFYLLANNELGTLLKYYILVILFVAIRYITIEITGCEKYEAPIMLITAYHIKVDVIMR